MSPASIDIAIAVQKSTVVRWMSPNVSEDMIKASMVLNLSLIILNKRPRKIISSLTATIENIAKFKISPIQSIDIAPIL